MSGVRIEKLSQRAIYDARYRGDGYDTRSQVRVLTAEAEALRGAAVRALQNCPDADELSVFDFGYGTGRVVNEFVEEYPAIADGRSLRIVAYDVAAVGLAKAAQQLVSESEFRDYGLKLDPDALSGYVAGSVRRRRDDVDTTVVFVHAGEDDDAETMQHLVLAANDGRPCLVTCSWYGGIGHVFGVERRRSFFAGLSAVTRPDGDLVIAVSSTGDLVEDADAWERRLELGAVGDAPIEVPGDVLYDTEIGRKNYYHVFGSDLGDYLHEITGLGQRWWVEGIRFPDEEFVSRDEEQDNYRRVRAFNAAKAGRPWTVGDYRQFHTVAGFRSAG